MALRWRADIDRAVAPLDLTKGKYAVLASLRALTCAGDTPSQRQLAERAGLGPIYVSKTIRSIERDGLVMRTSDANDRRTRRLSLTERGVAVADEAAPIVQALDHKLMAPLGDPRGARARAFATTLRTLLGPSDSHPGSPTSA